MYLNVNCIMERSLKEKRHDSPSPASRSNMDSIDWKSLKAFFKEISLGDRSVGHSIIKGLYCSSWLKTGPTGVIATTLNNSFDTVRSVLEGMDSGTLNTSAAKPGSQSINALLGNRGVKPVTFSEWKKIDSEEVRKGAAIGKPREKLLTVEEMLQVAGK
ncbi:hypothetical protein KUCAC02_017848 [Chaenocephalus aceratus]|nr:hypothetical protein KUCAC02_017848 [Chaenocephalus aceratus]